MQSSGMWKGAVATALGVMLAACGGGGGGGSPSPAALELSGTAATGAALAGATVDVKCAAGTGTAVTSSSGAYTVSITSGALPCMVRVSGTTPGGVAVTLHSAVEAGTADGRNTRAVANVTPVTEIIVARVGAQLPSEAFDNFDPAKVTKQGLQDAIAAVVTALGTAGIDLGDVDPIGGDLVAANGGTGGNAYDQLLDQLAKQVPPEALPVLVAKLASDSDAGSSTALDDAMAGVSGGALQGCPSVLSGKYRTLDYLGHTVVRDIDFKNGTFVSGSGQYPFTVTVDAAKPCTFVAEGDVNGTISRFEVAIGPQGIGTYRAQVTAPTPTDGVTGWIFPIQAHTTSEVAGEWSFLQGGYSTDQGGFQHTLGKINFAQDLAATTCDYDAGWTCQPERTSGMSIAARSDGGFDLNDVTLTSGPAARLYAYRTPTGATVLFGTTNPGGDSTAPERTSILATRGGAVELPEVGAVRKYAESVTTVRNGVYSTSGLNRDSSNVTAVDSAAGTWTQTRASDSRVDVWQANQPVTGMRLRDNVNGQAVAPVLLFPLAGAAGAIINTTGAHLMSMVVNLP